MSKFNLSEELKDKTINMEKSCVGCNLCMKNCHMLSEFCNIPKKLLRSISEEGSLEIILPYSCTLCNYCTDVCPKEVDLKNLFLDLRKDIIKKDKKALKSLGYNVVNFHQKNSFSKIFSSSAKALNTKENKRAFLPGCSLSSYSPDLVSKTYEYIKEIYPDTWCIRSYNIHNNVYFSSTNIISRFNLSYCWRVSFRVN